MNEEKNLIESTRILLGEATWNPSKKVEVKGSGSSRNQSINYEVGVSGKTQHSAIVETVNLANMSTYGKSEEEVKAKMVERIQSVIKLYQNLLKKI